ncbi:hypothetical protein ACS0TY_008225 [Phlomoides rotata]
MSSSQLKRMVFSVSWVVLYIPCKYQNEAFTGSLQKIYRSCGDLGCVMINWFHRYYPLLFGVSRAIGICAQCFDFGRDTKAHVKTRLGGRVFRVLAILWFCFLQLLGKWSEDPQAIMAWRLLLSWRLRLLNQWCNFVAKNFLQDFT